MSNKIKAVALDVDGVLTDGNFWWGPNGEEWKRFSFKDVMGISLARQKGLIFALISGENSPLVDRFAEKMGIIDIYKGCKDKATALQSFVHKYNLDLSAVCFMGDDINDLPALTLAGVSVAPANAHISVKEKVNIITQHTGGHGAVREFLDLLLSNNMDIPKSS